MFEDKLTVDDVAKRMHLSKVRIVQLIREGDLPAEVRYRSKPKYLINLDDLTELMDRRLKNTRYKKPLPKPKRASSPCGVSKKCDAMDVIIDGFAAIDKLRKAFVKHPELLELVIEVLEEDEA